MPLYLDVHTIEDGVALEDVAKAHRADLAIEHEHDVRYLRYWVDEAEGKVFCLVEAPSAGARRPCTAKRTDSLPITSSRSGRGPDPGHARHPSGGEVSAKGTHGYARAGGARRAKVRLDTASPWRSNPA